VSAKKKAAKKAARKSGTVTAYQDGFAAGTAGRPAEKGIATASVGKVAGARAIKAASRLVEPADDYGRYLARLAAGHSYAAPAAAELLAKRERGEHHITATGGAAWRA